MSASCIGICIYIQYKFIHIMSSLTNEEAAQQSMIPIVQEMFVQSQKNSVGIFYDST